MIRCELTNTVTYVDFDSFAEERWLMKLLSVDVPNAKFVPAFRSGQWDGKMCFFKRAFGTFPTGLLPTVLREHRELEERAAAFGIHLVDTRTVVVHPRDPNLFTTQRWVKYLKKCGVTPDIRKCAYQAKGIRKILSKTLRGMPWYRGIVQLPTGSGKTLLATGLLWWLQKPRTLFLCNRLDLLVQTKGVLECVLKTEIGIIGAGKRDIRDITVATVQSLRPRNECARCGKKYTIKRVKCPKCQSTDHRELYVDPKIGPWLKTVQVLIIDECHKVGLNEYDVVVNRVPAYIRLGLSATPFSRRDPGDVLLVGVTGETVYRLRSAALAARGLLARPVIELVPIREPKIVFPPYSRKWNDAIRRSVAMQQYRTAYTQAVIDNRHRNGRIASVAKDCVARDLPTLILVSRVRHGYLLLDLLKRHAINAEYLYGADAIERRKSLLDRFKQGEVPVAIASTIFDEAVDLPNIRALILAGAGNSPIKTIQRVGRGMRSKEGDNKLLVYDFLDLTAEVLRKQSMERIATYEAEGYEVIDAGATNGHTDLETGALPDR